jgi:hypothetical protein
MVDGEVIDPRTFRAELKPYLAEFLCKACAPVRAERFTSATEMRDALLQIRTSL